MLIKNLLSPMDVEALLSNIPRSIWIDAKFSAGGMAADVKTALGIPPDEPRLKNLESLVNARIEENAAFNRLVVPSEVGRPSFLMYEEGMSYGRHLDAPFMNGRRTDLSYTIFLTDSYEGGELVIQTPDGANHVKGNVGDMFVYESGRIHEVKPVTKGVRVVVVGWVQSQVPDPEARNELFLLKLRIDKLIKHNPEGEKNEEILGFLRLYNFLLRRFSQN